MSLPMNVTLLLDVRILANLQTEGITPLSFKASAYLSGSMRVTNDTLTRNPL